MTKRWMLGQFTEAFGGRRMDARDQLELRFGKVGRDPGVGQRRTQRPRVTSLRERAVTTDAQSLLLDAARKLVSAADGSRARRSFSSPTFDRPGRALALDFCAAS